MTKNRTLSVITLSQKVNSKQTTEGRINGPFC